jgi:gamma-glutamylputrescine oxidase
MDRDRVSALVKSPLYAGGVMDRGGGHLHPLAYARALAREAEAAGADIHELSEVTGITEGRHVVLKTRAGRSPRPTRSSQATATSPTSCRR